MNIARHVLVAGALVLLGAIAQAETPGSEVTLNIAEQPMPDALNALAEQTGLHVIFPVLAVEGKVSPKVAGRYTPQAALNILLSGTQLSYEFVDARTIAIREGSAASVTGAASSGSEGVRVAQADAGSVVPIAGQDAAGNQDGPDSPERTSLEEIVVTAQKREERLKDVPISITALNGADVQRASITKVTDLAKLVPNFSFESAFGSADDTRVTVRGITGNVRNAGFESGVSIYIDGVYAGRPASQNLNLMNIERVEVLRGPQGTLFGKNTIAGAINVVTRKPGQDFEGEVSVNLGNFNQRNLNGYISGPLAGDNLFFGASFFSVDRDGYVKNLFDGRKLGSDGANGGDLKLRYVASPDLEITARFDYLKDDVLFAFPETFDGRGHPGVGDTVWAPGKRTTNLDGIPQETRDAYGTSLTIDRSLGDLALTSITAYRESEYIHSEDNDTSPIDYLFVQGWTEAARYATQELRLTSPQGRRFDYLLGTYLSWQDIDAKVPFRAGAAYSSPGIATIFSRIETEGLALFTHTNYHVTDRLTLAAGVRYTSERKKIKDYHGEGTEAFGGFFNFSRLTDKRTDSDVSPMASITLALNPDTNVYAKVARGFKSGGWNTDFLGAGDGLPPPVSEIDFDAEHATTYEVGLKGAMLQRRLALNLAAFQTDYKDLQVQSRVFDPNTQLFTYQFNNAATSTIKGVELETTAMLGAGLSLRAGVGYTDATYDSFKAAEEVNGVPVDYDGNRLAHVPKWNGSLVAIYERPVAEAIALSISIDYSYKDSFFTDATNTPVLEVDSHSLVGGRIGFIHDQRWGAFLWAENLLDKDYYITKQGGSQLRGTWGRPRSYGIQLNYKF